MKKEMGIIKKKSVIYICMQLSNAQAGIIKFQPKLFHLSLKKNYKPKQTRILFTLCYCMEQAVKEFNIDIL